MFKWRPHSPVAAAAAAAALLGAGGIAGAVIASSGPAIAATSPSSGPSSGPSTGSNAAPAPPGWGPRMRGFGGPGPWGPGFGGPGFGRLLHGEATVRTPSGSLEVVDTQVGKVTGKTASTFTLTSTDGYQATYTVTGSTRLEKDGTQVTLSGISTGDQVRVLATKAGSALDAVAVMDGHPPRPPRPPFGMGPLGTPPTPQPSGTASPSST